MRISQSDCTLQISVTLPHFCRVTEALADKSDKIVIIKADDDVEYGAVMEAMDALRAVGIGDLGLITDPKRGSPAAGGGQ